MKKIIIGIFVCTMLITLSAQSAIAWKPDQHVGMGYPVCEDLKTDNKVNILGKDYLVNNLVANAISDYPQYYLVGTWGPDAYPDMYFGQSFVHPDTRSSGGNTYSTDWLRHVLIDACKHHSMRPGEDVQDNGEALAFAYGFITHAVGDMWCHTFVNEYAGGVWPELQSDMSVALRHMVIESYVNYTTTWYRDKPYWQSSSEVKTTLKNDNIFHGNFLYYAFINDDWAQSHSDSILFEKFWDLKNLLNDAYDILIWIPLVNVICPYLAAWEDDIIDGLKAWTKTSTEVAIALFMDHDTDAAWDAIGEWVVEHLFSMLGFPDWVVDAAQGLAYVTGKIGAIIQYIPLIGPAIIAIVEFFANIAETFLDWLLEQFLGINFSMIKSIFEEPELWLNGDKKYKNKNLFRDGWTPGSNLAPYGTQTKDKIDEELAFSSGSFDPYKWDMTYNTIMSGKLMLLDGAGLNELLADHGVDPLYNPNSVTHPDDLINDPEGHCAMLGFLKSLDANHQWMEYPPNHEDSYGTGLMRMWEDPDAREKVFKKIFHMGLNIEMPSKLDIVPGDTGIFDIEVINNGNILDTFAISVHGLSGLSDALSYELSDDEVTLDPGSSAFLTLEVTPVRHCSNPPAEYHFTVEGESIRPRHPRELEYDLIPTKIEAGIVNVLPFYEPNVTVTTVNQTAEPCESRVYDIVISNNGNVDDIFDIVLLYPDFNGAYRAFPTAVQPDWTDIGITSTNTLAPCSSISTILTITIPCDWAGMELTTYEVIVQAISQTDPTAKDNDSAFITVIPTKESYIRYINFEIDWLIEDVTVANIDPVVKAHLLYHLDNAKYFKEQALSSLLNGNSQLTDTNLNACKRSMIRFVNYVKEQNRINIIPSNLADDWITKGQTIINDIFAYDFWKHNMLTVIPITVFTGFFTFETNIFDFDLLESSPVESYLDTESDDGIDVNVEGSKNTDSLMFDDSEIWMILFDNDATINNMEDDYLIDTEYAGNPSYNDKSFSDSIDIVSEENMLEFEENMNTGEEKETNDHESNKVPFSTQSLEEYWIPDILQVPGTGWEYYGKIDDLIDCGMFDIEFVC